MRHARADVRYKGVVYAKDGKLLIGGSKVHRSIWFDSRQEAEDWIAAITETQADVVDETRVLTWEKGNGW